jgi:hypothetical protein
MTWAGNLKGARGGIHPAMPIFIFDRRRETMKRGIAGKPFYCAKKTPHRGGVSELGVLNPLTRKNSSGLHDLRSLVGFELYLLAFGQGLESITFDCGEMNKHIRAAVTGGDKTKSL